MKRISLILAGFVCLFMLGCQGNTYTTQLQTESSSTITETVTTTAITTNDQISSTEDELSLILMNIYHLAVESGDFDGTYEEWLETVRGPQGEPGASVELRLNGTEIQWKYDNDLLWKTIFDISVISGNDGQTPEIGENGNWWIGSSDTGISAVYIPVTDDQKMTDGLKFDLITYDGIFGYEVTSYIGSDEIVYLPNVINGMPVISIAESTFENNQTIKEVYVPSNVRRIGLFKNSDNLEEVTFAESSLLKSIPDMAFYHCDKLERIYIPDLVESIGDSAFYSAEALSDVRLGNAVLEIGDEAFYQCVNIENFVFNGILETIGEKAFYYSGHMTNYVIPSSVETIGYYAFYSYEDFCVVYAEIDEKPIGWHDQWLRVSDENITYWGVKTSDDYLYIENESQEAMIVGYIGLNDIVVIPESIESLPVTEIGQFALVNEYSIIGIEIPDSVHTIRGLAIRQNRNLRWVTIPSSVLYVEQYAMFTIEDIYGARVYVEHNSIPLGWSEEWNYVDDDLSEQYTNLNWGVSREEFGYTDELQYIVDGNEIAITGYIEQVEKLVIPEQIEGKNVTRIVEFALSINTITTEIILPSTIDEIGRYGFAYNTKLEKIKLNEGILEIGNYAFYYCYSLVFVDIPETVDIVGEYAFYDCDSLLAAFVPEDIYIIGQYAFRSSSNVIIYTDGNEKKTGWDSTWYDYIYDVEWNTNVDEIILYEEYLYLIISGEARILKYYGLESIIIIPNRINSYEVTEIASYAFDSEGVPYNAKIVIPESIEIIEQYGINRSNISIFLEVNAIPEGWSSQWRYSSYNTSYYFGDEWEYGEMGDPQVRPN